MDEFSSKVNKSLVIVHSETAKDICKNFNSKFDLTV